MTGKTAGLVFLGVCVILAALLLARVIGPTASGLAFAVALVVLGGLSQGFRKPRH
jgi:hypothetical protein